MVEGHSVHRIASRFRTALVGRKFSATSPNARFTEGADAINGCALSRMEAVGKNLFAFFNSGDGTSDIVVHGKSLLCARLVFYFAHLISFASSLRDERRMGRLQFDS